MMAAGFERHIERRAARAAAGLPERQDFRVRKARPEMKALPDDAALFDDHGADHWIRTGRPPALRGKTKSPRHIVEILCAAGHRFLRPTRERRPGFADLARDGADGPAVFLASASANAACAAASRAIATR